MLNDETPTPLNAPPEDLMKRLAQVQEFFPEGFVIFIPPQKDNSTWIGCFKFNPKKKFFIEAIYDKIVTGRMTGGTQN